MAEQQVATADDHGDEEIVERNTVKVIDSVAEERKTDVHFLKRP